MTSTEFKNWHDPRYGNRPKNIIYTLSSMQKAFEAGKMLGLLRREKPDIKKAVRRLHD